MTRLGDFLICREQFFLKKQQAKNLVTFWAILKYNTLQVIIAVATFWATFGLPYITTSGHTDNKGQQYQESKDSERVWTTTAASIVSGWTESGNIKIVEKAFPDIKLTRIFVTMYLTNV